MKEIWGIVIYKSVFATKRQGNKIVNTDTIIDWDLSAISSEMYNNRKDAEQFITTRANQPLTEVNIGHYIDSIRKTKYVIKGFELKD